MSENKNQFSIGLDSMARIYMSVSVLIMTIAAFLGGIGAWTDSHVLDTLHPYIFFVGFGNLAILILNRYLIAAVYADLKIDTGRQMRQVYAVLFSLLMVSVSVVYDQPLLKAATGLFLMWVALFPAIDIVRTLSLSRIWKEVSVRYYIFDVIFLVNANLGLFALGLKEAFPDTGLIPFFVTQSAYFLGSSFPLSISVMGFLYTYAWRRSDKKELIRMLFSIWSYVFVGGVLVFLVAILMGHYPGMMIISHILLFGVMALLGGFAVYLNRFFAKNFHHPALAWLLSGLAMLLATSAYGIFNIYFYDKIPFGSVPPIRASKMWIYHSHTHAALMGWITFSFIGMIYIVLPSIVKSGSLDLLRSGNPMEKLLDNAVMTHAFRQLTVALIATSGVMVAFWIESDLLLGLCGVVYSGSVYYLRVNLSRGLNQLKGKQ
ncbi:hypothetical protein [Prosthecochloris vibrioformis]|uniref:Cytochrome oxidase subunit I profile domain-containing protein n=1 Tax=Prosthecochloris vibrioformis TaxID=1098 RepID=A0A5C4RYS8_PROVB|nr:hypothetical protein [Prosthecochloris vibrioformis]TNJ36078.1 hypothetical protein FGF68_08550 [Prosthecochloris vibrioformis]